VRGEPREFFHRPEVVEYNAIAREVAALYDHVELIEADDFVADVDDFELASDRLNRNVYFRLYQAVMERCTHVASPPKAAA
jgi:L-asparaginase/Glu-tRNA(Gln) amidotransferase subunit D